jgi:hypothetical protein
MIDVEAEVELDQEETLMVLHDIFAAALSEALAQGVSLDLETLMGLSLKSGEDGSVVLSLEIQGADPVEVKVSPETVMEVLGAEEAQDSPDESEV